jgi:Domain of unknown function (DUF1877)
MSMIGNMARLPSATRDALHAHPELVTRLLYPDAPVPAPRRPGFLARLFGAKPAPVDRPTASVPAVGRLANSDTLCIDKAWHALHYLFTGTAWAGEPPADFLAVGGTQIGNVDVGYGPARSFTPAQVQSIAAFLNEQKEAELRSRIDPAAMQRLDIYPGVWCADTDIEEEWEYLVSSLLEMKQFVGEAAQANLSMIVYIN